MSSLRTIDMEDGSFRRRSPFCPSDSGQSSLTTVPTASIFSLTGDYRMFSPDRQEPRKRARAGKRVTTARAALNAPWLSALWLAFSLSRAWQRESASPTLSLCFSPSNSLPPLPLSLNEPSSLFSYGILLRIAALLWNLWRPLFSARPTETC